MSTVGEYILHRLHSEWGVERIYGYPGDGISGLMGAFNELGNEPEFIQVRHEVIASYAATAHSKFTGEPGVCLATSGPGAIQLLNGLYDAKLDHRPLVAIVGQQKRVSLGSDWLQEVDLAALFQDVSEFVQTCMAPEQARHLVDRAMRTAIATRGVACLIVPVDVQHAPAADPDAGPLIAIRLQVMARKSLGGIQTDLESRVLTPDGDPIPNLYACGEAAGFGGGGMHGKRSLEGTFLGGCVFSARIAAKSIAGAQTVAYSDNGDVPAVATET